MGFFLKKKKTMPNGVQNLDFYVFAKEAYWVVLRFRDTHILVIGVVSSTRI